MLNLGKSLLQPINECIVKAPLTNALQRKPSKVADKRQGQSTERLPGFNYGVWNLIPVSLVGFPYPHSQSAPGKGQLSDRLLRGLRTARRGIRLLRGFLCTESPVDTKSLCRLLLGEAVKLEVKGAGILEAWKSRLQRREEGGLKPVNSSELMKWLGVGKRGE